MKMASKIARRMLSNEVSISWRWPPMRPVEPRRQVHRSSASAISSGHAAQVAPGEVGGDDGDALALGATDLGRTLDLLDRGDRRQRDRRLARLEHGQLQQVLDAVAVLLLGAQPDVDLAVLALDVGGDVP